MWTVIPYIVGGGIIFYVSDSLVRRGRRAKTCLALRRNPAEVELVPTKSDKPRNTLRKDEQRFGIDMDESSGVCSDETM